MIMFWILNSPFEGVHKGQNFHLKIWQWVTLHQRQQI